MFPVFFPVFFQYMFLLETKRREGGFEPQGFFKYSSNLFQVLLCIFKFMVLKQKQVPDKYRKRYRTNIRKNRSGSKPPSWQNLWFLFMICYYCIFKQKTNTGKYKKYGKQIGKIPENKPSSSTPPSRLRFTVLLELHPKTHIFVQNRAYSPTMGCK